jgi:hypothetical protein
MKLNACDVSRLNDTNEAVIFYWNEFLDGKFEQRCYRVEITRNGITAARDFTDGNTAENKQQAFEYFHAIDEEFSAMV